MHTSAGSRMRELVRGCLDDVDELTDSFVAEVAQLDPYSAELIPLSEVRADARSCFEMLLRLIADFPLPERLATVSERIGRRRAQAGIPLDVLLQAVRLDFRILWAALLHRAHHDDMSALMDGAVTVWEAVERHTVGVHLSYLDEAAVLAREREQERSRYVAQLLSTDGRDPQVRTQVATALDVDPNARFVVAAGPNGDQRVLSQAADRLRASGISAHLHLDREQPILFAPLPKGAHRLPQQWLRDVPCGVGPLASGLAAVPRSVRAASVVAKAIGPTTTGPLHLHEVWSEVVVETMAEVGDMLADEVLSPMDSITRHERDRLVGTATSYLRSGSVADTAAEMFCHRNTVLNRIRRLGELTGGDMTRPAHAARVLIALRIRERRARDD